MCKQHCGQIILFRMSISCAVLVLKCGKNLLAAILPYILAYKSLLRISRPPKKRVLVWSKIADPRISRRWFLGTCTESSRYTHNAF